MEKKETDLAVIEHMKEITSSIVKVRKLLWAFPNDEEYANVFLELNKTDKSIKKALKILGVKEIKKKPSGKKILVNFNGEGFKASPEDGLFEVKAESGNKEFKKLSEAILYFEGLYEERFIWDLTSEPRLLDGFYWVDVKETK